MCYKMGRLAAAACAPSQGCRRSLTRTFRAVAMESALGCSGGSICFKLPSVYHKMGGRRHPRARLAKAAAAPRPACKPATQGLRSALPATCGWPSALLPRHAGL